MANKLAQCPESVCACSACKSMCFRPCWGTPQEIQTLIDKGYGKRLMLDYYICSEMNSLEESIEILCPALKGKESMYSGLYPISDEGCTFWNKKQLCMLHKKGLKPLEARIATCKPENMPMDSQERHKEIALLWDNEKSRQMIADWKEKYLVRKSYYDCY